MYQMASRAMVMQQKTGRPVQFEITQSTREALQAWITRAEFKVSEFLFTSRVPDQPHLSTRHYARIVHRWVEEAGLESGSYGTQTMRRIRAFLIHRRASNLRAVQLIVGHTKLESTVCYLGIEVDDALEIAEQTDVCTHKVGSSP